MVENNIWDNTPIKGFGEEALAEANTRIAGRCKYMRKRFFTEAQKRLSRLKAVVASAANERKG